MLLDPAATLRLDACKRQEATPATLWQGGTLAERYQVEAWLGEGAHGVVHRALELRIGTQVVINRTPFTSTR